MQLPDRGIAQGFVALACTILFIRGINWIAFKLCHFEKLVQEEIKLFVKNGVIELEEQQKISKPRLYPILRWRDMFHIGKIKRLYIAACGIFSIYQETGTKAGLSLYPPEDAILKGHSREEGKKKACCDCGFVIKSEKKDPCLNCGKNDRSKAIL